MAYSHTNTLELLTLQNQLLLTVGGSQNTRECMYTFMQTTLKLLGLKSIHLYIFDHSLPDQKSLVHYLSIPDNKLEQEHKLTVYKMLLHFKNKKGHNHLTEKIDDNEILAYAFNSIGGLVLEKQRTKFQPAIKDTLAPVIQKLANHYQFCELQKRLNNEAKINKKAQRTYELQAKRDPLTNLPNRREFRYALSKEISNAQRYDHFGALMYIDLDNFKNVNDSLGHSIGDILLTQVAQRLMTQARIGDTVFRIGGDEFVYILSNIGKHESDAIKTSQTVATRVINILAKPIEIGEFSLHITPSIGIAVFPDSFDDGNDSENILRHADTAMYRAKKQGRNCFEFFNPEMHIEANKRLIIEDHLRKAITNNELHLVYQPIVNTRGEIIAAESLIRWDNKMLGHIVPNEFINIAEESNLILELGRWITQNVCDYAGRLHKQLDKDSNFSYISINISPRQFIQIDFVESITKIIDDCSAPNDFIKLEFTESVLLDNTDASIKKMEELHVNNINFLLDDFGTGYSSLSYLHRLPIWLLKIDKSFVTDFYSKHNNTRAIVNAILVMTEELGINCIVEGVETQEQADFFKQKGVHGMQGFFFYKPMPSDALSNLVTNKEVTIEHA
ncbi:diguanylate cyclase/phosphodiesterase (GGDEF & EAL domains) with PAS/PAC sensor(s) [hydrothermal vent metagenome]|uniref:Diguanylate cyclase/phosphodiesterase (GGDEF & EAL domains) with PAS/PAC sensor(S) n=1 Tax=hydrothermal vent metagenome TaxID=652676 RepID=A0A3B0WQU4_9ZZZZ